MGVVHNGGDRFVGVGVDLHPAGDPGLHQPHIDAPLRDVQRLAHGDGGQGVLHVEQAGHGEPEFPKVAPGAHPEQDVAPPLADLEGVDVRLWVPLGEGEQGPARRPGRLQHPSGVVTVQVDTVDGPLGKNFQLGGEVVLKVRVLNG